MSENDGIRRCTKQKEFRDFVRGLPLWHNLVKELAVTLPTSISEDCAQKMTEQLKAKDFAVTVRRLAAAKKITVAGTLGSGAQKGEVAVASAKKSDVAQLDDAGVPTSLSLPKEAEVSPDAKSAESTTPVATALPTPATVKEASEKATLETPVEKTEPPSTTSVESSPPPEKVPAVVAEASTAPPVAPIAMDEIPRWTLSWGPSYLVVTGSGINGSNAGFNLASFATSYSATPQASGAAELLMPLNASPSLPSAMILHLEGQWAFHGARSTFKTAEVVARFRAEAIGGFVYFSQTSSLAQSYISSAGVSLLSEVATPYAGAQVTRQLSRDLALTGRFVLVPVFPLGGTNLSLGQEAGIKVEKRIDEYAVVLGLNWMNYQVSYADPLLGSPFATYMQIKMALKYAF